MIPDRRLGEGQGWEQGCWRLGKGGEILESRQIFCDYLPWTKQHNVFYSFEKSTPVFKQSSMDHGACKVIGAKHERCEVQ